MAHIDLNTSYEDLLAQKLASLPAQDKRETSMIYQATAANTAETVQMLATMLYYEDQLYPDTAPRERLILKAKERGLEPYPATHAIRQGEFNIDVPIGSRFSAEQYNYEAIEKIDIGIFKLRCETAGEVGNFESGTLIPIEYIDGLATAELTEVLIPGEDEEDTEAFRKRYFDSFNSVAFGGNRADYKEKVNKLPGVGGVRVYRAKYGGGTVGLTIIDSVFKSPSQSLIDAVQQYMDPLDQQGEGVGLAPIDHIVTVSGVSQTAVNTSTTLTLQNGWTFEDVRTDVEQVLDDYFTELAEQWAQAITKQDDEIGLVVRISQIETRLLGISGIIDIDDTTLNGVASNLELDKEAIPVRGDVIA